ncbi:MAG: hypothetical protein V1736_09580 [Pseudomonadota bacterium]
MISQHKLPTYLNQIRTGIFFLICILLLPCCAGKAVLSSDSGSPALSGKTIAVFPFENLSDRKNAVCEAMPYVYRRLQDSGIEIAPATSVERFLVINEIRNFGHFSGEILNLVKQDLGVDYVLFGSINSYSAESPALSVSARLVSVPDGKVLWGNSSALSGGDFKRILGLGKINDPAVLTSKVIEDLFAPMDGLSLPDDQETKRLFRVAVMPFENFSNRKSSGLITTYLFLSALTSKPGWEVVEYGRSWNVLVSENYRYRGNLDYETLQAMGKAIDVDGIILGTVEEYKEAVGTGKYLIPEVCISLRLLHIPTKTIAWADQMSSTGEDYISVFDWGRIRTADQLAQEMVRQMVKRLPRAEIK